MKKLSVNRHTSPALVITFVLATVLFTLFLIIQASLTVPLFVYTMLVSLSLLTSPWCVAFLWNRFLATEDKYYE